MPTLVLQSVLPIFLALKLACMLQDYRHSDERTCFLLKYFGFDFLHFLIELSLLVLCAVPGGSSQVCSVLLVKQVL